ncbi:MAG: EamA family transporter [Gammaproteobacteria bacterium]|nr:EamA family transporter [Gammaproteobacteria bacterium]NIM72178.1 EamA family transporter [Gammaproteobacteria bacterium]NIN39093.1 EamA family transporter [Gammaproteobacteria bacterium]NIO23926.1 EamA family transporter [Gammaproteobacteria bacterium]NIO64578.1 EamA family transporter [Gammaproteobacteria bacterium]
MSGSPEPYADGSVDKRRAGLAGAAWMLAGASCIGVVDGIAKYMAPTLSGVQIVWGYVGSSLICLLAVTIIRGQSPLALARTRRPWLQLARGASLVCSLSALFISLRYLPLAVATTVSFTAPLIITALSGPLLGERVGLARWLAVLGGMAGATLVIRPGTDVFHWASLLTIVGAFFFALFNVATRMLGGVDRALTTVLYTFVVSTALVSLVMPLVWVTPTAAQWALFALSGLLGFAAHFSIARSLTLADASAVAPLHYVRLLWAIGIGLLVFDHVPEAWTLAGGALIVASGIYVSGIGARVR